MSLLRRLIPLVVVFLIGYAGWKVPPRYLSYFEFKSAVEALVGGQDAATGRAQALLS